MSSQEGWLTKAKEALSVHEVRTLSLTVVTVFVIAKKFCRKVTMTL